jgi:hypothetical protein
MPSRQELNPNAERFEPPSFEPRSLEWQDNGELAANEMFELVKRLRAVESGEHVNELWRLSQKG